MLTINEENEMTKNTDPLRAYRVGTAVAVAAIVLAHLISFLW